MGKALKSVGAVIGAAALIATGAGAILMPGMAGTTTLFGVSVGTLNTVSAGLMAVGGMLDKPESMGSGTPDEWNSNPDQPTPFAFGRVGCSGKIVHRDEYGKDNKLQGIVSVYSGAGPIKSFVSYKVNDLPVSFVSNGGTATGKYNRQMWRSWRLGEQPDTALSLPTGLDEGAVMPAWGPAYKLSGKACELLTVQQDSKFSVYPMGLPTPQAVIEGIYGYDPRYDSTYPGGFGDCRLGVRSTYRWINNPIIAGLNWALGMVENGHVVGGIGASPQGIDMPAFVDAANVSDANGWTVSAWPDTSEDVSQVLKQFLQAGGASYARHAGKISCVSRGVAKPSIVTVTGRDTCGPIELDTGASLYNRINTITPSFMSEAHGWKHVPADPVTFEALRIEDGGKRGDQITYRFADNARQAGQLAAYDILDAREPFSGTVPFKPHLRRLKPGDCFVLDEPGFLLDGVKCIVLGRSYNAQIGEVRVSFRSETDGKHSLAHGKTTTMPEYPVLTPADPTLVSPPLPEDWVLIPKLPNETGVQVPIIDIVGEVSNSTATAVHFEWTYDNNGVPSADWISAGIWPPTVKSMSVPADPGSWIWIGASYLRGENFSERQPYGPVRVPALISDDTTHLNGEPVQDILDKLTDVETLSASNALAVADLDGRVDDTVTAAEAAIAAGEAANLAVLKAGEAGDAATASNISAGIATTKADEAGNSATAANAAKLAAAAAYGSAVAAAIAGFPDVLAPDLLTGQSGGSPATVTSLNPAWFSTAGLTAPADTAGTAFYKQTVSWKSGEVYEFDYEVEGLSGTTYATVYGQYLDASYAGTTARSLNWVVTPNGVKTRIVQRVALDRTVAGATTWALAGTGTDRLRFGVIFNRTNTGTPATGQSRLTRMTVRNVTAQAGAEQAREGAIIAGGNQGFEEGLTGWGTGVALPPGNYDDSSRPLFQSAYQGRNGVVVSAPGMGRRNLYSAKLFPIDTTRKYRVRTSVYVGPAAAAKTYVGFRTLDAAGGFVGSNGGHQYVAIGGLVIPADSGWKEYVSPIMSGEGVTTGRFNTGTKLVQLVGFLDFDGVNGSSLSDTAIDGIWLEDVTESENAKAQAMASVTSAAEAAASAGEAGDWAAASEGSAVQAGAHAADGLAYRNQSVDARDGAVAAQVAAGTSASAAQDAEDGASAERLGAENAAATAVTQSSNASASASSAQISAILAAKSGVQNEYVNADLANGVEGFRALWGFGGPLPTITNTGEEIHVFKQGGQWTGTQTLYGLIELVGGSRSVAVAGLGTRICWPVYAGEKIGWAVDARTRGGSARWSINTLWCSQAGDNVTQLGTVQTAHGVTDWQRRGVVTTAPADGYLWIEATALLGWDGSLGSANMGLRRPTFARMRADATDLPEFTAPAGSGALAKISSELAITASVAASTADQVGSARFGVTGGAGGDPFDLELKAGPEGSTASMTATALRLKNVINGVVHRVMDIVDGFVHIMGPLYIGPNREIELNPISAYPFISIRVGSGRIAMGRLPNDNLIYWFGPFQEVVNMRKSNATEWRDTGGRAYFGGQIFAGTLSNSAQGSNTLVPASVTLGPFGSNGAPITVVWSYTFTREGERWGKQDTTVSGNTSALVRLYRKIGTGAEVLLDSMVINGAHNIIYTPEPSPGQPAGTTGKTLFTELAGGSRTYTDNAGGTQSRTYRVVVATRSNISVAGDSPAPDAITQGYSAVSSE